MDQELAKAIRLYKKFHPEAGNEEPKLEDVLRWLMDRSGAKAADEMQEKLTKAFNLLMTLGVISPDQKVVLMGSFVIELRALTKV